MVGNTPKMSTNVISPANNTDYSQKVKDIIIQDDDDISNLVDEPEETDGNQISEIGFDGKDLNLTSNLSATENLKLLGDVNNIANRDFNHSVSQQPGILRELSQSEELLKMTTNNFL